MSLKEQAISGVFWSSIERFGALLLQFILNIILARLLSSFEFGLVGMLYVFTALGDVIVESGFGQALIRKNDVSQKDYSSVFFLNLIFGLIIYLFFYFLSPYIANFFKSPELELISKFVFLVFPINALALVQNTIIIKNVKFKVLAKVSILSALLSGSIGIYLAYTGYGVWALVYQAILYAVFRTIFLWIFNKWRPSFVFSFKSIKELLTFSLSLLGTNSLIVIFNNIYTIIIGKFYPVAQVGLYNQAKRMTDIPSLTLTTIVQNVSYPILCKLQDNDYQLKQGYRKVITMVVFINFPVMLGLLAIADNFIFTLLSEKWMSMVPYFQLLCVYGAFFPLHSINVNILKVKGEGKKLLTLEILRRVIVVVAIVLTLNKGVITLLIGNVIAAMLSILINMYYCGKQIRYSVIEQIKDILPYFLISVFLSFILFLLGNFISIGHLYMLILQIIIGITVYVLMSKTLRLDAYNQIYGILINEIKK